MALIFKSRILVPLLCSIIIDTFLCECPLKDIDACDTGNASEAFLIYMSHGVTSIEDLCTSIDGETNRIHGYDVCVLAAAKHYPHWKISSAICVKVKMDESKSRFFVKSNDEKDVVECADKSPGGYSISKFYVTRVADNKYYVSAIKSHSSLFQISACMTINVEKSVIPKINLRATSDSLEADDMFGLYGVLKTDEEKGVKHICDTISKSRDSGKSFCRKALSLENNKHMYGSFLEKSNVNCHDVEIHRQIVGKQYGRKSKTAFARMVKCLYENWKGHISYVMMANTPVPSLYYIASMNDNYKLKIDKCVLLS